METSASSHEKKLPMKKIAATAAGIILAGGLGIVTNKTTQYNPLPKVQNVPREQLPETLEKKYIMSDERNDRLQSEINIFAESFMSSTYNNGALVEGVEVEYTSPHHMVGDLTGWARITDSRNPGVKVSVDVFMDKGAPNMGKVSAVSVSNETVSMFIGRLKDDNDKGEMSRPVITSHTREVKTGNEIAIISVGVSENNVTGNIDVVTFDNKVINQLQVYKYTNTPQTY